MKANKIDTNKSWHLVDAKNKILGRISTDIASILSGKNKVTYTKNIDQGDYVIVINAKNVALSGKKETSKNYYRHSGYPGGLKWDTAAQVRSAKPEMLIRHAVVGMLPKNKLGKAMAKKLFVYADEKHPYENKITTK
jgi:large subunit ribosomal protein L13